jgi:hypothetical protein
LSAALKEMQQLHNPESTLLTAVIDALEDGDVTTCDIPSAFIQTDIERVDKDGNHTIMKFRGVLVDILCEIDKSYIEYVTLKGTQKVLYMHIIKAIYGLLVWQCYSTRSLLETLPNMDSRRIPTIPG